LKSDDRWATRAAWVAYLGVLALCINSVWRPNLLPLLDNGNLAAWVQAIGSVLAIFAAVWITQHQHHLDLEREERASTAREVELCNRALLILGWQFEYLLALREQYLDPFRGSKARHLEMTWSLERDIGRRFELDSASLAFLVAHGALQVPFNLSVLDERFRSAVAIVNVTCSVSSDQ
jgi:hypothetical protein